MRIALTPCCAPTADGQPAMASPARGSAWPTRATDAWPPEGETSVIALPGRAIVTPCCAMCSFLAFPPKHRRSLRFALGFRANAML